MPTILQRVHKPVRSRGNNRPATNPQPVPPILITDATAVGSVLTLTFDQAVRLEGTPAFTTSVAGATPVSAVQSAPNVVAITYSAAIAAATTINLGFRDPAIRSLGGGFVTSNTFPV